MRPNQNSKGLTPVRNLNSNGTWYLISGRRSIGCLIRVFYFLVIIWSARISWMWDVWGRFSREEEYEVWRSNQVIETPHITMFQRLLAEQCKFFPSTKIRESQPIEEFGPNLLSRIKSSTTLKVWNNGKRLKGACRKLADFLERTSSSRWW